ncbi:MAG: DUF4139 domain-containing protein [Nitrospirae bacterium]|nr:MAG: DUF4139 domain-containing protein [Nitrospirota bacterium]
MKKSLSLISAVLLLLPTMVMAKVTVSASEAKNTTVTIYNDGSALIYEELPVRLSPEDQILEITGLPSSIQSDSINIMEFEGFRVLSYSFEPPNLSRAEILKRYLNKKVQLVLWDKETGSPRFYDATLLGTEKEFYFELNDRVFLDHPGTIVIPEIPEELHKGGLLRAEYKVDKDTDSVVPLVYLAGGINWDGSYVLSLLDEGRASLKCFASIENRTGRDFQSARVTLIAGSLHREYEPKTKRTFALKTMAEEKTAEIKQTFEYHEYPIPNKLTIKEGQKKEVLLFETEEMGYKKEYVIQTSTTPYQTFVPFKETIPVKVYITFKNTKENHLGIAMPEGIVRIYGLTERRHPVFLGSDRIEHTPKDEEVRLFAGDAFDIKVKKRKTDYTRLSRTVYEAAFEVSISNHKSEPVRVKLIENLSGQWEILSTSHKYRKLNASTIEFSPLVPAGSKLSINYRVRISQ